MVFPLVDRVKYEKNPLVEVVLQYNFKDCIDKQNFSLLKLGEFHRCISNQYPFFTSEDQHNFSIQLESEAVSKTSTSVYRFASIESTKTVLLTNEWIAFATSSYRAWEEFKEEFCTISKSFHKCFEVEPHFKRVGLRYRDVIDRRNIDITLANESWSELLGEGVVPPKIFADGNISTRLKSYQTGFLINLDGNGKLAANIGLIQNAATQENAFLIDGDFFIEEDLDDAAANKIIDCFNVHARNFFGWCIKPKLHEHLHPTPYPIPPSE